MFRHMEAEEHQTESPLTKVKIELPNLPTEDMGEPTDTATAHFFLVYGWLKYSLVPEKPAIRYCFKF